MELMGYIILAKEDFYLLLTAICFVSALLGMFVGGILGYGMSEYGQLSNHPNKASGTNTEQW